MTASSLLYADLFNAAGSTWFKGRHPVMLPEPCAVCGGDVGAEAVKAKEQFGASFSDQDVLVAPDSQWVCECCSWALGSKPPKTLRTWSIVYREDWTPPPANPKLGCPIGPRTWATNKADLRPVLDTLVNPPRSTEWVVSVADSGQIHTMPFATVNRGAVGWVVRFERADVRMRTADFVRLAWAVCCLYGAGFSKDDINSGRPNTSNLAGAIESWLVHEPAIGPYIGSPALELATFLQLKKDHRDGNRSTIARAGRDFGLGLDGLGVDEPD